MAVTVASDSWRRIRRLRAHPPLLAGVEVDETRTRVFQAALAQAEELWEAASVVGAASRPLPLFYCLSQAGRAVCAAWTTGGAWEPTGHGLTTAGQEGDVDIASFEVRVPNNAARGMYPMVAAATDSMIFEGSATIAALWAALPDLPRASITQNELMPLHVEAKRLVGDDVITSLLAPRIAGLTYPRPPQVTLDLTDLNEADLAADPNAASEALAERLRGLLVDYPSIADGAVEVVDNIAGRFGPEHGVILRVPDGDGGYRPLFDFADRTPSEAALSEAKFIIRPRQGTGFGIPPSQLMTLWALLYGLSQLARHHPAAWVGALNPDRSPIAVDLEHVLDSALELVPDLLVPAVSNGAMPRLVREHVAAERERARLQEEVDAEALATDEPPAQ